MKTNETFNLDREFIVWFYEDEYPVPGSTRSTTHANSMVFNPDSMVRDYWMREAFKQGAKAMWDEINFTLASFACTVEGLDPEMVEPCEIFDRARENLFEYVKQLELFDETV